jgi:hypothetical protein
MARNVSQFVCSSLAFFRKRRIADANAGENRLARRM